MQLYVHDGHSKIDRPAHELKGFKRVELKPGESQTVQFKLDHSAFEYWSPQTKEWAMGPAARLRCRVGASSRDIRLQVEVADALINSAKMPRQIHYNAAENIAPETAKDPYLRPAFSLATDSPGSCGTSAGRSFYRLSPRPLHGWRSMLLRLFGAKMGANCHFYPCSRVWAPWNLDLR